MINFFKETRTNVRSIENKWLRKWKRHISVNRLYAETANYFAIRLSVGIRIILLKRTIHYENVSR